jgi:hypothetical protein
MAIECEHQRSLLRQETEKFAPALEPATTASVERRDDLSEERKKG